MAITNYFEYLPNFEYVARGGDQYISNYTTVKNLFKRAKINEEIYQDLNFFTKYKIIGDKRPDQVAYELYQEEKLDWLVMLTNNIMNLQTEWPMDNISFYNYVIRKYGSEENLSKVHHYVSKEVRDSEDNLLIKAGIRVPSDFFIIYFDDGLATSQVRTNIASEITNYEYEVKLNEEKREIFILKPEYISTVIRELKDAMRIKQGTTQFQNFNTSRGENIIMFS